jgi:hypothetical protein
MHPDVGRLAPLVRLTAQIPLAALASEADARVSSDRKLNIPDTGDEAPGPGGQPFIGGVLPGG